MFSMHLYYSLFKHTYHYNPIGLTKNTTAKIYRCICNAHEAVFEPVGNQSKKGRKPVFPGCQQNQWIQDLGLLEKIHLLQRLFLPTFRGDT